MSGTIPTEFGQLTSVGKSLESIVILVAVAVKVIVMLNAISLFAGEFGLSLNQFTGTLPSALWLLSNLGKLL